jgi:ribosomal protein S18 acetylase RimI-like enzyme
MAENDTTARIAPVDAGDLPALLPLLRAYCDFYEVAPTDDALLAMSRELLGDPMRQGVQLLARTPVGRDPADGDPGGAAVGFATVLWSWQTLDAAPAAVMNDLYVAPSARGSGLAEALIAACAELARAHGAPELVWQTALDNHRAQAVYERIGARSSRWLDYTLEL